MAFIGLSPRLASMRLPLISFLPEFATERAMNRSNQSDIASFPELFDDLEQFVAEQSAGFKRLGIGLTFAATTVGGLLAWVVKSLG